MQASLTRQEYQTIVENTPNLVWRAGLDAKCNYFNKTWLTFTGRSFEQEYGDGWVEGVHPDDVERCFKTYVDHFHQRTSFEMEYRLRRHDGEWRWINDRGVPYVDEHGEFAGYIGSCLDVTDKVDGLIYKEISQKDSLTGVLSRQYLISQFQHCFDSAKAMNMYLAVAMMDIDQFKKINDQFGHLMGDSALKLFASVVKDKIRSEDLFGRYGGDEFLIVFRHTTYQIACEIIDRIKEALQTVVLKAGQRDIVLSISAGICALSNEVSLEEMINRADQIMYEQKKEKHLTASTDEGI